MKNILLKSLLFLFTPMLFSCGNNNDKQANVGSGDEQYDAVADKGGLKITKVQFEGSAMQLGSLEEKTFPIMVEATGIIDVPPENKAMVSSFAAGYVKQTPLLIGDKVKKGQFLVSLENPDYIQMQQEYLDAMEQMKFLKSEYDRQKVLMAENITSEKNFLKSESDYKRNLSRYNAMRKKLQMLNLDPLAVENGQISSTIVLYAPISGSVTEMNVNKGQYVSASDELMQIIDRDHLHIELNLFEKDVMHVNKGQTIRLTIPEASGDTIEGEVYLVGASINEEKRTVKVHGHFKEEGKQHLAIGMFVQAEIITNSNKTKALPAQSVVNLDDTSYIFVLQSEKDSSYVLKRREVMPGQSFNGFTEILNSSDFQVDARFLVKGAFPLMMGE